MSLFLPEKCLAPHDKFIQEQLYCRYSFLGRVDELLNDNPCCNEMNQRQKGLAQFLIPRGNAPKLFEVIKEPFDLLA